MVSQKYAFFRHELKNANISFSYDKLLARFGAHHNIYEKSKLETITDTYKLGYWDCTNGTAPFYAIRDGDIEALCPDLLLVQRKEYKEWITEEAVVEEDGAKDDAANEMVADVAEQAGAVVESVANQVNA